MVVLRTAGPARIAWLAAGRSRSNPSGRDHLLESVNKRGYFRPLPAAMRERYLAGRHRARENHGSRIADDLANILRQQFPEIGRPEQGVRIKQNPQGSPSPECVPSPPSDSSSGKGWSNRSAGRLPRRCASAGNARLSPVRLHRHQPHRLVAAGDDDFLPRLGAGDEV